MNILYPVDLMLLIKILAVHYVADYIFQTQWQAHNKSSNVLALLSHVSVYSLLLLIAFSNLQFAVFNGACHFFTDAITSRLTKYFYSKGKEREFFWVLGFDQFLHMAVLFTTAYYYL